MMCGSMHSSCEYASEDVHLKDFLGVLAAAIKVREITIMSPKDLKFKSQKIQIIFDCDELDVVKLEAASAVSWTSG